MTKLLCSWEPYTGSHHLMMVIGTRSSITKQPGCKLSCMWLCHLFTEIPSVLIALLIEHHMSLNKDIMCLSEIACKKPAKMVTNDDCDAAAI